jgi:hypothetical protein
MVKLPNPGMKDPGRAGHFEKETVSNRFVEGAQNSEVFETAQTASDAIYGSGLRFTQTGSSSYPHHNLMEVAYVTKANRPQFIQRKPLAKAVNVGGKRYRVSVAFGRGVDNMWKIW